MISNVMRFLRVLMPHRSSRQASTSDDAMNTARGVRERLDVMTTTRKHDVATIRLEQMHIRRHIRTGNFAELRQQRKNIATGDFLEDELFVRSRRDRP